MQRLSLRTGDGTIIFDVIDLLYIKADGNSATFHLRSGKKLFVSKSLKNFEHLEQVTSLFRANRSFIVNADHITMYDADFICLGDLRLNNRMTIKEIDELLSHKNNIIKCESETSY